LFFSRKKNFFSFSFRISPVLLSFVRYYLLNFFNEKALFFREKGFDSRNPEWAALHFCRKNYRTITKKPVYSVENSLYNPTRLFIKICGTYLAESISLEQLTLFI